MSCRGEADVPRGKRKTPTANLFLQKSWVLQWQFRLNSNIYSENCITMASKEEDVQMMPLDPTFGNRGRGQDESDILEHEFTIVGDEER